MDRIFARLNNDRNPDPKLEKTVMRQLIKLMTATMVAFTILFAFTPSTAWAGTYSTWPCWKCETIKKTKPKKACRKECGQSNSTGTPRSSLPGSSKRRLACPAGCKSTQHNRQYSRRAGQSVLSSRVHHVGLPQYVDLVRSDDPTHRSDPETAPTVFGMIAHAAMVHLPDTPLD